MDEKLLKEGKAYLGLGFEGTGASWWDGMVVVAPWKRSLSSCWLTPQRPRKQGKGRLQLSLTSSSSAFHSALDFNPGDGLPTFKADAALSINLWKVPVS